MCVCVYVCVCVCVCAVVYVQSVRLSWVLIDVCKVQRNKHLLQGHRDVHVHTCQPLHTSPIHSDQPFIPCASRGNCSHKLPALWNGKKVKNNFG